MLKEYIENRLNCRARVSSNRIQIFPNDLNYYDISFDIICTPEGVYEIIEYDCKPYRLGCYKLISQCIERIIQEHGGLQREALE